MQENRLKKMTFSEKISKILTTNKLGIDSASGMEKHIGAGQSAITMHTNKGAPKDSAPGLKIQKRIVEKLRISQDWWDTGKGEIYLPDEQKSTVNEPIEKYDSAKNPDLNLLFIETIKLLIEKNDNLVQDKNSEIAHLRGNENWFKAEFSKLTTKLGPPQDT